MSDVTIRCDDCHEWDTLTPSLAVAIEDQAGRLLCTECHAQREPS